MAYIQITLKLSAPIHQDKSKNENRAAAVKGS
jgi:hypothetical protein